MVEVYFSPNPVFHEGIAAKIIADLAAAKTEILNLDYSVTNTDIVAAICAAINRGVRYQGAWDKGSTSGNQAKLHDQILKAGGNIKLVRGFGKYGIQHAKVFIIDGRLLDGGSYNFTFNAESNNYEFFLRMTDRGAIQTAVQGFQVIYAAGKTERPGVMTSMRRLGRRLLARNRER